MLKPVKVVKYVKKENDAYMLSEIYVELTNVPAKYVNKAKKIDSNYSPSNFVCRCGEYILLKVLNIDSLSMSHLFYQYNDELIDMGYDICKTNVEENRGIIDFVLDYLKSLEGND